MAEFGSKKSVENARAQSEAGSFGIFNSSSDDVESIQNLKTELDNLQTRIDTLRASGNIFESDTGLSVSDLEQDQINTISLLAGSLGRFKRSGFIQYRL